MDDNVGGGGNSNAGGAMRMLRHRSGGRSAVLSVDGGALYLSYVGIQFTNPHSHPPIPQISFIGVVLLGGCRHSRCCRAVVVPLHNPKYDVSTCQGKFLLGRMPNETAMVRNHG